MSDVLVLVYGQESLASYVEETRYEEVFLLTVHVFALVIAEIKMYVLRIHSFQHINKHERLVLLRAVRNYIAEKYNVSIPDHFAVLIYVTQKVPTHNKAQERLHTTVYIANH